MKKLLVLFAFIAIAFTSQAQRGEFGPMIGTSYYVGDVNPGLPFAAPHVAYGALYRYNFTQRWTVRVAYLHGKLSGNDRYHGNTPERNWSFQSTFDEASAQVEVNMLPYITGGTHNVFSTYLFCGLAVLFERGESSSMDPSFQLVTPAMPFGLGFKMSLNKWLCLGGEWGYRKTLTDKIDNLPHKTPDQRQLSDSKNNDWYSFAGLTLTYSLRLKDAKRCTTFENRKGYY
ncbi:MAG: hypothetical protein CSA95_03720 [Bacteroidetes bacterium]|nr:MAG: hypothetical protein CSA95_03720 [Bacteroidota bacterium]